MRITLNRRFAGCLVLAAALSMAGLSAPSVLAQQGVTVISKMGGAKAPEISADTQVRQIRHATRGAAQATRPTKKGGKSEAIVGQFTVDNWTDCAVDLFVDEYYAGDVPPYGKTTMYFFSGHHTLYGRTSDGKRWGPISVTLNTRNVIWKIIR